MPIRRLSILAIVALPTVALALAAGTYRDAASSLTWQDPPGTSANDDMMSWAEAKAYCAQLELGGVSDWRLPSIDELRSLVRNSPKTQSGGACGVKAGCLGASCRTGDCDGDDSDGSSCHWPTGLKGSCSGYWSASANAGDAGRAWLVLFYDGGLHDADTTDYNYVRCVSPSAP